MSKQVYQDEHFLASPEEVFNALADSEQHSAMTGAPAVVELKRGGRHSAYGGAIEGEVLEVKPPKRLAMKWRGKNWPKGKFSKVIFDIEAGDDRTTVLHLTHEDLPNAYFEECSRGWGNAYWSKMREYFKARKLAVVDRFVAEYKNNHNWNIVDEIIAEDCKVHIPLPGLPQGREGMRINGKMICTAFPDVYVEREFHVIENDVVVEHAHAKATHKAELMGIPATNNPVTWSELHAYRVRDGVITEIWTEADFMGIMVQIGAVQMPG